MKIKNAEKLAALCLAAVMGVSVTACSGGNMYATSNESATIADNDVITIAPGEIEIPVKMLVTCARTERPHGALL